MSHIVPVLFLGLAHLLLDQAGWRGGTGVAMPGTLLLDLGLMLLALTMSWGFALSVAGWVTSSVNRLEQLAASPPARATGLDWTPVGWDLDRLAHRILALMSQNRRGLEALAEVEAVRDQAAALLKGWGEPLPAEGMGPGETPARFWRRVRRGLMEHMADVSRRARRLAERTARCRTLGTEVAQGISQATIETESLFLEASHEAVTAAQRPPSMAAEAWQEVREGLETWTGEATTTLDASRAGRLAAWRDWILHCLDEGRNQAGRLPGGFQGHLDRVSRRMESLGRACEGLVQELEASHVLAMEIHGALPAVSPADSQEA